jgi:hypothetical protein
MTLSLCCESVAAEQHSCCRSERLLAAGRCMRVLLRDASAAQAATACACTASGLCQCPHVQADVLSCLIRNAFGAVAVSTTLNAARSLSVLVDAGALRATAHAVRTRGSDRGVRAAAVSLVLALARRAGDGGAALRAAERSGELARALADAAEPPAPPRPQAAAAAGASRRGKAAGSNQQQHQSRGSDAAVATSAAASSATRGHRGHQVHAEEWNEPCNWEHFECEDTSSETEEDGDDAGALVDAALCTLTGATNGTAAAAAARVHAADVAAAALLAELEAEKTTATAEKKQTRKSRSKAAARAPARAAQARDAETGAAAACGTEREEEEEEMDVAEMARALRGGIVISGAAHPKMQPAPAEAAVVAPSPPQLHAPTVEEQQGAPAAVQATLAPVAKKVLPRPRPLPRAAGAVHSVAASASGGDAAHEDDELCIICLDAPRDTALPGCASTHAAALCAPCAVRVAGAQGAACCPLCRAPVHAA